MDTIFGLRNDVLKFHGCTYKTNDQELRNIILYEAQNTKMANHLVDTKMYKGLQEEFLSLE